MVLQCNFHVDIAIFYIPIFFQLVSNGLNLCTSFAVIYYEASSDPTFIVILTAANKVVCVGIMMIKYDVLTNVVEMASLVLAWLVFERTSRSNVYVQPNN